MKVMHGVEIDVEFGQDFVWLGQHTPGCPEAVAGLTPKQARKLAKKLRRAADEVDGARTVRFDSTEDFLKALEPRYTLTLTEDQAKTLAVILGRIGGTTGFAGSTVTARKYAEEIREQLGIDGLGVELDDPRFAVIKGIYFVGVAE